MLLLLILLHHFLHSTFKELSISFRKYIIPGNTSRTAEGKQTRTSSTPVALAIIQEKRASKERKGDISFPLKTPDDPDKEGFPPPARRLSLPQYPPPFLFYRFHKSLSRNTALGGDGLGVQRGPVISCSSWRLAEWAKADQKVVKDPEGFIWDTALPLARSLSEEGGRGDSFSLVALGFEKRKIWNQIMILLRRQSPFCKIFSI